MHAVLVLLAGAACGLLAFVARADEVSDQIEQAKSYYEDGDVGGAIGELEFAIQALRGKLAGALLETFPAAPSGWTAADSDSGTSAAMPMMGGNVVERTYSQDGGEGRIEARLMSGGGFMQGLASMFMNPAMLAAQPNAKRVRFGRENGVVIYDPADRSGQLMVDLGGKISLMLEGSGLAGPEPMTALVEGWDLKKVKELAGL